MCGVASFGFSPARSPCEDRRARCEGREDPAACPVHLVVFFSGKRKAGKDFITDRLLAEVNRQARDAGSPGPICEIGRLSGPLKKAYAEVG